jgi:hypothetical protein
VEVEAVEEEEEAVAGEEEDYFHLVLLLRLLQLMLYHNLQVGYQPLVKGMWFQSAVVAEVEEVEALEEVEGLEGALRKEQHCNQLFKDCLLRVRCAIINRSDYQCIT